MNSEIEKQLWARAEKYINYLRIVPFLKMVSVCNNLAFGKVDEKSDIDLFVIAKSGRLFFVRTFVTLILHILGVRRHGDKVAGRFCLSFFIDEDGMNMKEIALDRDIYLAFWVKTMVPVLDDGVYKEFIEKNEWVDEYFEERVTESIRKLNSKSGVKKLLNWMFKGWFGDRVESVLKKWQKKRAKKKMLNINHDVASLVVSDHILKFHNVDRRREYRDKWFEKYPHDEKLSKEKVLSLKLK